MKKILKGIYILSLIICAVILVKLIYKISINKIFINNYPNTNQEYRLKMNTFINLYEPYVAYYNYGNYFFQKGEYDKAYEKYLQALEYDMPNDNLCKLSMNIALTLYKQTDGLNATNKVKLLKEAESYLQKCLNTNIQNDFPLSTALLMMIIVIGFALIILALIMKNRMGLLSNTESNCLRNIEIVKNKLITSEINKKEARIETRDIVSNFIKANTKVNILTLSKDEINRLGINDLNKLIDIFYSSNFNNENDLDLILCLDKMMEVIKKWNWN